MFEKLREAALAYQLERHWDKDKILTEYLNVIYFGQGAYGIEAAAKTYFGWNHPGCGEAGSRCASQLLPWEAAMLAGLISNPSGFDPKIASDAATARRNLVLQKMAEQGYIDPGGRRAVLTRAAARSRADQDSGGGLEGSLLHLLAPPAAGRQVRRRRGLRRRAPHQLHPRPLAPGGGAADRLRPHRRGRPELGRGGARQRHRRGAGDGRRLRLPGAALQPRHPGPATAGLRLQAVHPGDGARAGHLARRRLHLGAEVAPLRDARESRRHSRSRSKTTRTTTWGAPRSPPRRPTPTTRCTPSWASRSAPRTSPRRPTRWASRRRSRPTRR